MVAIAAASNAANAIGQTLFDPSQSISRDRVYAQKTDDSIALKYASYHSSTIAIDGITETALDAIAKSALSLTDKQGFISAVAALMENGGDPALVRDITTLVNLQESQNSKPTESMTLDDAKLSFTENVKAIRQNNRVFSMAFGDDKVQFANQNLAAPMATFGAGDPYLLLAGAVNLLTRQNPFATPTGNAVNVYA